MKTVKSKKTSKWSKVSYELATYKYISDDQEVAAIFPKETKEGRIAWGYFIKRIGNSIEVNNSNYNTEAQVKLEPYYMKKRDVKKAIESAVERLKCQ